MRARRAAAIAWLLASAAIACGGCDDRVGPTGLVVGGPCVDTFDCAAGSYCLRRSDFPSGTCTVNCASDGDCPGDSVCIEDGDGVCLLACAIDEDCGRDGYACDLRRRRGAPGEAPVCSGR